MAFGIATAIVYESPVSTAAFVDPTTMGPQLPSQSAASQQSQTHSSMPAYLTSGEEEAFCSDEIIQPPEQCDDGNTLSGDGCSQYCTTEQCGNGNLDYEEQCDDGNTINGDGCSNECSIEFCGDGNSQIALGEQCDDGNNVPEDGCDAECTIEQASSASSLSASVASSDTSSASASVPSSVASTSSSQSSSLHSAFSDPAVGVQSVLSALLTPSEHAVIDAVLAKKPLSVEQENTVRTIIENITQAIGQMDATLASSLRDVLFVGTIDDIVRVIQEMNPPPYDTRAFALSLNDIVDERAFHGMNLSAATWDEAESILRHGAPLDVLKALLSVRAIVAAEAPEDLPATIASIGAAARSLLSSRSIEREYPDVDHEALVRALTALRESAASAPDDLERLLSRLDAVAVVLRDGNVDLATLASHPPSLSDRAAFGVIAAQAGLNPKQAEELADALPPSIKETFREGTLADRRQAVIAVLQSQPLIDALIELLPPDRKQTFVMRRATLIAQLNAAGTDDATFHSLSHAIEDGVMPFLHELTADVSATLSPFDRFIQFLQDTFGIS